MATAPESTEAFADTSIWSAVILEEPSHEELLDRLGEPDSLWIAAPVLVEAMLVLERRRIPNGIEMLERLLSGSGAQVLPFDTTQARLAHEAFKT